MVDDTVFDRFVTRLRARLAAGAREYGDRSFTRPAAELVELQPTDRLGGPRKAAARYRLAAIEARRPEGR